MSPLRARARPTLAVLGRGGGGGCGQGGYRGCSGDGGRRRRGCWRLGPRLRGRQARCHGAVRRRSRGRLRRVRPDRGLEGPLPRERHHISTTATAARKAPPKRRAPSPAVTRTPAPITHTIHQSPATATSGARRRSSAPSASPSNQASSEFGFEGAGGTTGSAPASSSSSRPSARAASAGAQSAPTTPSSSPPPPAASGHKASTEFGFE